MNDNSKPVSSLSKRQMMQETIGETFIVHWTPHKIVNVITIATKQLPYFLAVKSAESTFCNGVTIGDLGQHASKGGMVENLPNGNVPDRLLVGLSNVAEPDPDLPLSHSIPINPQ